ncbi:MAG: hypothetical protein KAR65_01500 [Anaerolineales bacterium]|nr:hypothetical protein [Anaerolineales bacterium]
MAEVIRKKEQGGWMCYCPAKLKISSSAAGLRSCSLLPHVMGGNIRSSGFRSPRFTVL